MTETEAAKAERMLEKVRALLAKADSTDSPAEAEAFRAKAEELMVKYRIEEEALLASDPQALTPEWAQIRITDLESAEFVVEYHTMFYYICDHVGVRYRPSYVNGVMAAVCGYASDIKLADLLYTSARLGFSAKLTPGVDPNLSEEENIYRLRSAGVVRGRVAEMLWGKQSHSGNAKVGAVYKAECAKRGETPALDGRGVSAANYRKVYAREFATEIARRLRGARSAVDKISGAVQLHGRAERVEAEFYGRYPELRPSKAVAKPEPCPRCAKRTDGSKCRDHKSRPVTKAERDRYERENYSATAVAAQAAGRRAAREVALDGSAPAQRIDHYTAAERDDTEAIRRALGK